MTDRIDLSGFDRAMLGRARGLRLRGRGGAHPNPMVGCVIVSEGRTVGRGWHAEFGGSHAEVMALREAGEAARGATAYVSLEPCAHFGQTPPCSEALIDAGVARVVFGAADPGDASSGGAAQLRDAGIEVVGPCLSARSALADNPSFFHRARTGRPYVAGKLAMSLDARIAARPGDRTPITGEEALAEVHRIRAEFSAIVVGARTVEVDDPLLTARGDIEPRVPPIRIVLDAHAALPLDGALAGSLHAGPVWVFCSKQVAESRIEELERAGIVVHPIASTGDEVDLAAVVDDCAELGLASVLVEGGGRLVDGFGAAGLLDRFYLFTAPSVLGSAGVPAFPGKGLRLDDGNTWGLVSRPQRVGNDVLAIWDRTESLSPEESA